MAKILFLFSSDREERIFAPYQDGVSDYGHNTESKVGVRPKDVDLSNYDLVFSDGPTNIGKVRSLGKFSNSREVIDEINACCCSERV